MSHPLHCALPSVPAARTGDGARIRRLAANELPPVGAHLSTPRWAYTHHGIHVGNGRVVHYAGLSRSLVRGPVEVVSLAHFAGGHEVFVHETRARFRPEEIVARALSRLGEDLYRLSSNNCEHFCAWCRSGESRSEQVERIVRPVRAATRWAADCLQALAGAKAGFGRRVPCP